MQHNSRNKRDPGSQGGRRADFPELSSDLHTCTHMHTCTHTCTPVPTPALAPAHMHTCTHTCTHTRESTCLWTECLQQEFIFSQSWKLFWSQISWGPEVALWGGCSQVTGGHAFAESSGCCPISFCYHQPYETMTSFYLSHFPSALCPNMAVCIRG